MMSPELQSAMRLGSMLVDLEVLTEEDLSESAQVATELALPLGKVLVMSGFIDDDQLQAIIQAQSMLKDQLLTAETAKSALRLVMNEQKPWDEALKEAGWVEPDLVPANKLGTILVDSGIIDDAELETALDQSKQAGLPLGRILALTNKISDALLHSCLNAQVLLRDNKINREQATAGLKAARERQNTVEQAYVAQGGFKQSGRSKVRIGELLMLSGLLSEEAIMESLETGLMNNETLGQVLVRTGQLDINQLDACLKLQELVEKGQLIPVQAADALREIATKGADFEKAVSNACIVAPAKQTSPTVSLTALLKSAGLISDYEIDEAIRQAQRNSALVAKILSVTGYLDEETAQAALRCQTLLKSGQLTLDRAITALSYCRKMGCSLDQALRELGWANTVAGKI